MTKTNADPPEKRLRGRAIISLLVSWMFLIMGLTGLVLYIMPQGRIAFWLDWHFLGLSKADWGNIHIVSSLLFAVVGGWHIYYNWRALLNHLRRKLASGIALKKELFLTVSLALLVVASALWHLPPLGYLVDFNTWVKDAWISAPEDEPPFGHAELLSLKMLARRLDIDLAQALPELRKRGFQVGSEADTLEAIAKASGLTPKDIYRVLRRFERRSSPPVPGNRLTAEEVFERFEGQGVGKKTMAEACSLGGESLARCQERLEKRSIEAEPHETLKEVADRYGKRPIEVLQALLVD